MRTLLRRCRASRSLLRDRSGQALVETALVTPVLLFLILGVVDLSRAWGAHQVLTNTAREALRSAVVDNPTFSQQQMYDRIRESLTLASLDPSVVDVTIEGWRTGTGSPARIQLRYPFEFTFLAPLIRLSTGKRTVTLSTAFVMRNE
jgi:Flp pilus assembly protein TadG